MFLFFVAGLLFHPGGHAGCCTLHTGCTRSHEFDITHTTVALVVWDGDRGFRALIQGRLALACLEGRREWASKLMPYGISAIWMITKPI